MLNQKGGVGKTALTVGAAGALAERGRRVLLIDLDPQGHLSTQALGLGEIDEHRPNLASLLTRTHNGPLGELIVRHSRHPSGGCIDVIPTSPEMFLVTQAMYKGRGRRLEWSLDDILATLDRGLYDHIGIDCPPALDILTDNALVAAAGVLIPVQPSRTSLRALGLLLDQITVLETELRLPPRTLLGMAISLYRRPLTSYTRYIAPELEQFAAPNDPTTPPLPVLAHLPLATAVEEAWLAGTPVTTHAPRSSNAEALRRIATALDVFAGLTPANAWHALDPLPSLTAPGPSRRGEPAPTANTREQ